MSDTLVKVDQARALALEAAVSAGGAASVQEAVESALDAWLTEQTLSQLPDDVLRRLWREGIESGVASALDLNALKSEARHIANTP